MARLNNLGTSATSQNARENIERTEKSVSGQSCFSLDSEKVERPIPKLSGRSEDRKIFTKNLPKERGMTFHLRSPPRFSPNKIHSQKPNLYREKEVSTVPK